KLQFVEEPVEIVDREVRQLKRSQIPLVKIRWNPKRGPEFTWEREDQFRKKYPHLFARTASTSIGIDIPVRVISYYQENEQDQPLPADASPIALSPDHVVDSDPEKDEKDLKEDPADYPADRGNNDEDESSNDDDDDDNVEKDEEDKEEEGHLAPVDPSDVSTYNRVPSS
nr:putative reverse transcriptase domain-containing protein [Tanacetum cinerariifolium]